MGTGLLPFGISSLSAGAYRANKEGMTSGQNSSRTLCSHGWLDWKERIRTSPNTSPGSLTVEQVTGPPAPQGAVAESGESIWPHMGGSQGQPGEKVYQTSRRYSPCPHALAGGRWQRRGL
eukprot:2164418-Rhodomonas_salina.1